MGNPSSNTLTVDAGPKTSSFTLTILGAPRTKKNSMQIVRNFGRPGLIQSKAYRTWERTAILQLRSEWSRTCTTVDAGQGLIVVGGTLVEPIHMNAQIFRDRDAGDYLNYLAAVSDVLEASGVIANDRLIQSVDGSRLRLDRARPRVEITLSLL